MTHKQTDQHHSLFVMISSAIISTILAFLLFHYVPSSSANIALVYILALILTAHYTNGYLYGIIFSLFSVICVNFFFTRPYFELNFTLTGYPITFIIMFSITLLTSTTTSHTKIQAKLLTEREEIVSRAEKEKMRANLLRAISHDLRTPLTSIIGETNAYFEQDMSNSQKEEVVHKVNDDAIWLLHMVENLLLVTRIQENEKAKVNKSTEIVEEIVSEAIYRFKQRQPDAKVNVSIPDHYIELPMDPLLIEQVIINLLDNAYIHSKSNKPIDLKIIDENTSVSFHVRDYGIGIEPELLSSAFDGLSSRSSDVSDAHRGMGIGLSICKTIIEAHDGTIIGKNRVAGVEFIFQLPKEDY